MLLLATLIGYIWAQVTVFYSEDFTTSPTDWTLNSSDMGGVAPPTGYNLWRVGAHYNGQSFEVPTGLPPLLPCSTCVPVSTPTIASQTAAISGNSLSPFLHISYNEANSTAQGCLTPSTPTTSFLAADGLCYPSQTYFAKYSAAGGIAIPAGSAPVKLSFIWLCQGGTNSYGEVLYSTSGPNGPWNTLSSNMYNQSGWKADTFVLPIPRPSSLWIAFRFVNNATTNASDPPLAVDVVRVFEETTTPSLPSLDLVSATPSTVCAGSSLSVTYTAQNFPSGTTYTAQLFDGSGSVVSSASGNSPISLPIPNIIPSGTYRVRVAASTTPATYSDTATVTVVNVQSLACSALPNPAVPGSQVTLEVRGTGLPNGPFNVTVDPGDGSAPLSQNGVNSLPVSFTHTYSSAGSYTATFTVTHPASGCTGTCQATVQVGGERLTALVLRDSTLCEGDSFYVDYTSIGITFAAGNTFTVQVRDGGGNVVTSCSVNSTATSGSLGCQIPTGTPTGNYSVRIISSNPAHTSNSLPLSVRTAPLADFAPDANLRFCAGEPITFTDRSQGAVRVQWDFGDGQTSSSRNPTHTYAQAGTYTVTLVASVSATCTSRIQRQIDILPSPQASFTVTPPSLTLPDANTATFTNTSTGAVSYQWNFGNGQTSTAPNPTATYDREGEYVVTLTAISADGCQDTAQYRLKVTFAQGLIIPGAFTPNGDGINDRYSIRYTGMQNIRLSVYDRWGNLIFTQQLDTPAGSIEWDGTKNGQALPEGVYAAYVEGKSIDGRDIRRSVMITLLR
ncbi:MAG: PKD domain-containing protein [Bacteroidia bacterium]|nr:PKD domain-containing protein [Bacteroidia bacterium]